MRGSAIVVGVTTPARAQWQLETPPKIPQTWSVLPPTGLVAVEQWRELPTGWAHPTGSHLRSPKHPLQVPRRPARGHKLLSIAGAENANGQGEAFGERLGRTGDSSTNRSQTFATAKPECVQLRKIFLS